MNLFSDPVAVGLALLTVIVCFAVPVGTALVIIKKIGLWDKMKEELDTNKENR